VGYATLSAGLVASITGCQIAHNIRFRSSWLLAPLRLSLRHQREITPREALAAGAVVSSMTESDQSSVGVAAISRPPRFGPPVSARAACACGPFPFQRPSHHIQHAMSVVTLLADDIYYLQTPPGGTCTHSHRCSCRPAGPMDDGGGVVARGWRLAAAA
jgi:hypothetical protein